MDERDCWARLEYRVCRELALACVDLDGDGDDELAVARRDADHDLDRLPSAMGVLIYDPRPGAGKSLGFDRRVVDDGGIAAENLVAGGRETHNLKICWDRGAPR